MASDSPASARVDGSLSPDPSAAVATPIRTWSASIGNAGVVGSNGTAALVLDSQGTGTLDVTLKGLVRGKVYPIELFLGRWMPAGASWTSRGPVCESLKLQSAMRFPALRATASGTIIHTFLLTPRQMTTLNKTPRRLALVVGVARYARCGSLRLEMIAPPPASPSPTPSPSSTPLPPCAAWSPDLALVLTRLTVPTGLCLRIYTDPAQTPEIVRQTAGLYTPNPPTVSYFAKVTGLQDFDVLAHEICHAHQDRLAQDAGAEPISGWYKTEPGMDYLRSIGGWRETRTGWIAANPWSGIYANPLEESADVCAFWFDPTRGPRWLRRADPARFEWAQRWLPLPWFIIPYQPPS